MNGDTPVQPASNPTQPDSPWQYKPDAEQQQREPLLMPLESGQPPITPPQEVTWTASEFIDHHKGVTWYLLLGSASLVIIVLVFLWTRDVVSVVALAAMAVLLGVVAQRKPRVMEYRVDNNGLSIGETLHPFREFRSFAVQHEGPVAIVTIYPLKRFMPPVSVYYDIADEERITDALSHYLPFEVRERGAVDRFSRRIRF